MTNLLSEEAEWVNYRCSVLQSETCELSPEKCLGGEKRDSILLPFSVFYSWDVLSHLETDAEQKKFGLMGPTAAGQPRAPHTLSRPNWRSCGVIDPGAHCGSRPRCWARRGLHAARWPSSLLCGNSSADVKQLAFKKILFNHTVFQLRLTWKQKL